MYIECLHS